MEPFDPSAYGPTFDALLRNAPLMPLDPGRPDTTRQSLLAALEGDNACRAGLWLLFNFLDESHTVSQELHDADGSYWHAMMHRREMDFSNSKYWFRRVGVHPIYSPLQIAARELAAASPDPSARFLETDATWDAFAFVDLCENSLSGRSPCVHCVAAFSSANGNFFSTIATVRPPARRARVSRRSTSPFGERGVSPPDSASYR